MNYISQNMGLGISLLGNAAGIIAATSFGQRAFKYGLLAFMILGVWAAGF